MTNVISIGVPALFYLLVVCLCAYLLVRGVRHAFVSLFAAGAFLHGIQTLAYLVLLVMRGGYQSYTRYLPILGAVGALGTVLFAAAFVLLTLFLLPRGDEGSGG